MGFFKYYRIVIAMAFRHSLDWAQAGIFVLFVVAGIFSYVWGLPDMSPVMTAWQAAAVVFGGIILVRLLLAPYWVYRDLKATIPILANDLRIALDGRAHEAGMQDSDGRLLPGGEVYCARIFNDSGRLLENCQLRFGDENRDGQLISEPFDLLIDESKPFRFLRILAHNDTYKPYVYTYFLKDNKWQIHPAKWIPEAGKYVLTVFSANAKQCVLKIRLNEDSGGWRVVQC